MQPTLFTAAYAADRAVVATPAPRPARRARIGRKAAAVAAVVAAAVALSAGLATTTDAHSNAGFIQHADFGSAIVSPGQFGWQAHCPHTGPAPR